MPMDRPITYPTIMKMADSVMRIAGPRFDVDALYQTAQRVKKIWNVNSTDEHEILNAFRRELRREV